MEVSEIENALRINNINNFDINKLETGDIFIYFKVQDGMKLSLFHKIIKKLEEIIKKNYSYSSRANISIIKNKPELTVFLKKNETYVPKNNTNPYYNPGRSYAPSTLDLKTGKRENLPEATPLLKIARDYKMINVPKKSMPTFELNHIDRIIRDRIPPEDNYYIKGPINLIDDGQRTSFYWSNKNRTIIIHKLAGSEFVIDVIDRINKKEYYYICKGVEEIRKIKY